MQMVDVAVSLIPFTKDHMKKTFTWVEDPDIQRYFLMRGQPTWEGHKSYIDRILKDSSQCVFAIIYGDLHCGNCGLKNIVSGKESELWIYIGDVSLRGRGIGQLAVGLLVQKGFELFHLEMIYVHFGDFNVAARHLYERMGFGQVPLRESTDGPWVNRTCKIVRMELERS